jgi:hypothetical protein
MRDWLWRLWRRWRDETPRRALRAAGQEAEAGTLGRVASAAYGVQADTESIWDRDWDVCCLLDGCRVDLMTDVAAAGAYDFLPRPEDVETLWSVGSQSAEWMARTFDERHAGEMRRTAYVTGNPFSAQSGEQIVAVDTEPMPLDAEDFGLLHEAWREEWTDDEISTIPPEPLTEAAIAIWRERERLGIDRVLVHYMQPHTPFRSRPDWFLGTADIEDWGSLDDDEDQPTIDDVPLEEVDEETKELLEAFDTGADVGRDPWTRLRDRELPAEPFWAAYRDNLEWVLDDVARLLRNCDGTVALSSDHGNAAGEFGVWSHPPGVHLPALREVPWITVEASDEGTLDPPLPAVATEGASEPADVAEERLVDLGYR